MLSIAPPPTIFLHSGATDMRKSFDGLSGIIRGNFGGDPADGSLFLFVNKRSRRCGGTATDSCSGTRGWNREPLKWCHPEAAKSAYGSTRRSWP